MNETLLIGCGNLGLSITEAFLGESKKISIIEKKAKTLNFLKKKKSKLITIYNNLNEINFLKYKYLMICVKPQDIKKLIKQLNEFIKLSNTVISFVAGIKVSSLSKSFHMKLSILRFMPNLSIRYGKSITAVYSSNVLEKEKKKINNFFTFFGSFIWVSNEEEINFFTAFFGGGPAYISYFLKCLQNILKEKKINNQNSLKLIFQLLNGTIDFLEKEKIDFSDLIKKVASKGGTTEKALMYFSKNDKLEHIINDAIKKAEKKSKDLSKYYN